MGPERAFGDNVNAGVGFTPADSPLGFRVEALYNRFIGRSDFMFVCGASSACDRNATDPSHAGVNLGGGIRWPIGGASAYAEARIHTLSAYGTRFVPISIGVIF